MTASFKMRAQITGAVLAAFALRLYFIWQFPFNDAGDTPIYEELARNWMRHGVYGLRVLGQLVPSDMRTPGYPAFLAAIYTVAGQSTLAVRVAQAGVDVLTCVLIAAMAALLAPEKSRPRVALAALWLAALCPFTANYTVVVLSETLATFLTALALVVLIEALGPLKSGPGGAASQPAVANRWFLAGVVAGFGALVRPETPLVLGAAGALLLVRWWHPRNWAKLARAGLLMSAGLLLPLLPWAARNWQTLHKVQFLSPRYAQSPGEYVPRGFYAWTNTWLWRVRDVYLISWNVNGAKIHVRDVPSSAFDSPQQRQEVAALFAQYNQTREMTAPVDKAFSRIARARTARDPLRTYLEIPFLRALNMWFVPRVEMLPFSGHLWPVEKMWNEDPVDFSVSLGFALLAIAYVALGVWGAWRRRMVPATMLLVAFLLVRTAFLTTIETPEPRYMMECFPALLALAAQVWARRGARSEPPLSA